MPVGRVSSRLWMSTRYGGDFLAIEHLVSEVETLFVVHSVQKEGSVTNSIYSPEH